MAAFTSGADWSFAALPGGWQQTNEQTPQPAASPEKHTTENAQEAPPPPRPRTRHYPPRQCRICLEVVQPSLELQEESAIPAVFRPAAKVTYTSEDGGRLLRPCKCKGSQKYVHEECLNAWRLTNPLRKRNYWECPTCLYRYSLQRLTWATYISSTAAQIALTIAILFMTTFLLGFVADPIINLYLDPYHTLSTGGGPTGSLIYEDQPASWTEHFTKGLASIGLLGFLRFPFKLNPITLLNSRIGGGHVGVGRAGTGRDRINTVTWLAILVGVAMFLVAVWKGVRSWARWSLEAAGERVLDGPGGDDDEHEDNDNQ